MNVRVIFLGMLLVSAGIFCSCEQVKDSTTTDISVTSASINIDEITVDSLDAKSTADELNFFSADKEIKLEDLSGLSDDAIKYSSKIESAKVDSAEVTINIVESAGTIVKEFKISADDVNGNFFVETYDIGTTYVVDNTSAASFAGKLLTNLFLNRSVTLHVTGKTDIPSGDKLTVQITFKGIVLTASLL